MPTIHALDDLDGQPHATAFPDSEPKTIRLTLEAGESVAAHDHPDREIAFYLVEGELTVEIGADSYDLSAGDVARFDGDQRIAPHATADSTALIVLAERADS
jgi:quercetin dioxygenase-like cupin family protein